jgi:hypothetical protein
MAPATTMPDSRRSRLGPQRGYGSRG